MQIHRFWGNVRRNVGGPVLLLLLACGTNAPKGPAITPFSGEGRRPDVVMVTLDTTRADHIGAYGAKDARTDTIDTLANNGIRFDQAYSPLPLTIPAHSTMMTGLLPFHHHVRSNGDNILAPEFTTLAEHLSKAGYATGASVAAFVTNRDWGLNQGFSAYYDTLPEDGERNYWHAERPGNLVVDDALAWVNRQGKDKPLFLWVHLYDAHFPYAPPAEYLKQSPDRPYDAELAFVDDQVQRLVSAFAERKVLWCLVGDHGEGLGEHEEMQHGNWVYNATQHVPWVLSGAGVTPGVVTEPVSTADVTPSILRILGLPVPDDLDGKPQPGSMTVPYSESWQLADRYHLAPQLAVVSGPLKLVANPKPELYDVVKDPKETQNLAATRPEDVTRLQGLLAEKQAAPPGVNGHNFDPETLARLSSLGYTADVGLGGDDPSTFPDPKDFMDVFQGLRRVESEGLGPAETLELLRGFSARLPRSFELLHRQVRLLQQLQRKEDAQAVLEQAAALFPTQVGVWLSLAESAKDDGNLEQSLTFVRKALELEPSNTSAQESELGYLLALKRNEEALQKGEGYMKANPRNYGVAAVLGRYYLFTGNLKEAEGYLRVAVSATNPRRGARVQLALLAKAAQVRQDAYDLLADEIKEYPGNLMARRMMATMLGEDRRYLDQVEQLKYLADTRPEDDETQLAYAQGLFNLQDYRGCRRLLDMLLERSPDSADILLLHANLLNKEGKKEEGRAAFLRADAIHTAQVLEQQKGKR